MSEKQLSKLVRESEKFLSKHKGHKVEAPWCADSFYFNSLVCDVLEGNFG